MLLIYYIVVMSCVSYVQMEVLLKGIFWEVKPFIFTNKDGVLDGIIPRIFAEGQHYCAGTINGSTLLKFVQKEQSRKAFYNLLNSDISYGEKKLSSKKKRHFGFQCLRFYKEKRKLMQQKED